MNGILNYVAPRARCPKAVTYGILSGGIASIVCALPSLINTVAEVLQAFLSHPRTAIQPIEGVWMVLGSSLAMLALPIVGLLFAGMSVATSRRDYQCAMIGIIVNISGLFAGVGAVFLH